MSLLDWISDAPTPTVEGRDIVLRPPRAGDHAAWAALRDESRDYLIPWEPTWPEDDLSKAAFKLRLAIYGREMEAGNAWPFFVFGRQDRRLRGAITLSNVRRGVAQTGVLGYWIGQRWAGRGHASDAVMTLTRFAFDELKLHRVEAACVPGNIASRKVLERAGFENEGFARAYLKINGEWADHLLFGRVNGSDDRGDGPAVS